MTGWLGTAVLMVGCFLVTGKRRAGFLWSLGGNLLWMLRGYQLQSWDLIGETAAFALLAAWGWWRWRKP